LVWILEIQSWCLLDIPERGLTNYLASRFENTGLIVKYEGYEDLWLQQGIPNPAELLMSGKVDTLFMI
jgi:hypothetical protein